MRFSIPRAAYFLFLHHTYYHQHTYHYQHQVLYSANEIASSTQRSRIFNPAKSNPSPNEVVSLTQRSRILQFNETYELAQ